MIKILTLILFSLAITSCSNGDWDFERRGSPNEAGSRNQPPSRTTPETSASLLGIVAVDSLGNDLGYILSASASTISIINSNEYMYDIYWDGEMVKSNVYYTLSSCAGTAYYYPFSTKYPAKYLATDGDDISYLPANTNTLGIATVTSLSTLSKKDTNGTCVFWTASGDYIELTQVTRSALGIQNTIIAPISLNEN